MLHSYDILIQCFYIIESGFFFYVQEKPWNTFVAGELKMTLQTSRAADWSSLKCRELNEDGAG